MTAEHKQCNTAMTAIVYDMTGKAYGRVQEKSISSYSFPPFGLKIHHKGADSIIQISLGLDFLISFRMIFNLFLKSPIANA